MKRSPKKEKRCPHCGEVLPKRVPRKPDGWKIVRMTRLLARAGRRGLTDDEMDKITKWGHQTTTPAMLYMRHFDLASWVDDKDGNPIRRLTRKKCPAQVNVLAKFLR
jgi:hypothetical protein